MIRIGNFFFRTRNYIFPLFYMVLFLPFPRISPDFKLTFMIGLFITILGQSIRMLTVGLVYVARGGKKRRIHAENLVTDGMFSHARNPLYVGNIFMIVGMSILSNSLFAILFMIPLFIFIYQAIVRAEENFLKNKFGIVYDTYCKNVNRWLINPKGFKMTLKKHKFDPLRVLFKEDNTTTLWTLGALSLLAYNQNWFQKNYSIIKNGQVTLVGILTVVIAYLIIRFLKKRKK